jgi:MFS transporter, FHS family, glucose/mannose:H+ symporter
MRNKILFIAACLGMFLAGVGIITLGSVAAKIKLKYQLDEIAAGTLFSVLPLGIIFGSLIFGPVCDRFGYRLLLSFSALFIFAGFIGIAFAPGFFILIISIFLFSIGGGAINGASNALVSDISEENKRSRLSLLGVSFAIGALGMPAVLGLVDNLLSLENILSAVSLVPLLSAIAFLMITYPAPKQEKGFPLSTGINLLKDKVLLLIAFFLFCQSSMEGLVNNWTTTFLSDQLEISGSSALFGLSLFVVGMALMRLAIGSLLKNLSTKAIFQLSFLLIFTGALFLSLAISYFYSVLALVCLGGGLAGGFPIMLGLVGERFKEISGTAFSFVFVIALSGNMLINYMMGIIAENFGIKYLTSVIFLELGIMILLSHLILNKTVNTNKYQNNDVSKAMA